MKYNGIVIADEHFGVINPKRLYDEHMQSFIYYLSNMKKIDFIVICGDYFDKKMYANDESIKYASLIMEKIVDISINHKCPIRIIYGTRSHESDQYGLFDIYTNRTDIDFRVIYTVDEEELLPGINVLYIPEEFILSKKDYYKNYFDNTGKYNYVFGHGIIYEVMTKASKNIKENDKETTRKKVPSFSTMELSNICRGKVFFGHYHINTNIDDRIFYVGSFSRWCFGEEEPKGFYHIIYDDAKDKYTAKFIENCDADTYKTISYGYNDKIFTSDELLLDELNNVDKIINDGIFNNIRLILNIPESHPNPEFIINTVREKYKFNQNIKIDISNGYIDKKKKINKEKLSSVIDKYGGALDKSVSLEERVSRFIEIRYNTFISSDDVKSYLYDSDVANNE